MRFEKKKDTVQGMFDAIAPRYDFLNHFLSLGIDKLWRKKVRDLLKPLKPQSILDVAAGTADLSCAVSSLRPKEIKGIDISEEMLKIGRKKVRDRGLDSMIELIQADVENLPFADNHFNAVIVAFGVRNFENRKKGLHEIFRVIKDNGVFIVLEFSKPTKFPVKQVYNIYFNHILPFAGRVISGDKSAYSYLPGTVNTFPCGKDFTDELDSAGFTDTSFSTVSFGIASIYTGRKKT